MKIKLPAQDIEIPELDSVRDLIASSEALANRQSVIELELVELKKRVAALEEQPSSPLPSGPLEIPAYVPGPPVGQVIDVSVNSDTDIGKAINAADKALGGNVGTIQVEGKSYLLSEQARISPGHHLRLSDGLRAQVIGRRDFFEGWIVAASNTSIVGIGTASVIEPKEKLFDPSIPDSKFWSHVIIQSEGNTRGPASGPNAFMRETEISENIKIHNLTIQGSMMAPEGGSRSTIQLGNAHNVNLSHLRLIDTSSLGITAGGKGHTGNHAEEWLVKFCEFIGVASQAFAVVNGRRITFESSRFLRSGKLREDGNPYEGMSCIDAEPNTPEDLCRDLIFRNIEIDSTGSKFPHGNGVVIQNTNETKDFGPVLLEGIRINGGLRLLSGFQVFGSVENVTLRTNHVENALHSLYWFENGTKLTAENNTGVGRGRTGSESVEIQVNNVTHSTFKGFRLRLAQGEPETATMRFFERGNSRDNVFEDNVPAPVRG